TTYARDPFLGSFGGPFYYDPFYYGSPYFYEPFGYRGAVIFEGGSILTSGSAANAEISNGGARVINGQGYTRIVTRDSTPATNNGAPRTAATSRSEPSDSGSSS